MPLWLTQVKETSEGKLQENSPEVRSAPRHSFQLHPRLREENSSEFSCSEERISRVTLVLSHGLVTPEVQLFPQTNHLGWEYGFEQSKACPKPHHQAGLGFFSLFSCLKYLTLTLILNFLVLESKQQTTSVSVFHPSGSEDMKYSSVNSESGI